MSRRTGSYSQESGIPNATVELKAAELRYTTNTDGQGRYSLNGLEPGLYKVNVSRQSYVPDDEYNNRSWGRGRSVLNPETRRWEPVEDPPGEIAILPNSCEIRDLAMWASGSVVGTVRAVNGTPIEGVPVQAFGPNSRGESGTHLLRTAATDAKGKYTLHPLPAGRYVIGVNADPYADENPYPPTRYREGLVHAGEGASVAGIDLVVSEARTPARLRVKALAPDGKPYKGASVRLDTLTREQRWFSREETDDNGELLVPAYLGESYIVKVVDYTFNEKTRQILHLEETVQVNVTTKESELTVVLRPEP